MLARVLFAAVFLVNAAGLSGAFADVVRLMGAKGLPAPAPLLALIILAWVVGGMSLLAGFRVRLAATTLALLMVPVTLGMHSPWTADATSFQNELNHFLKNIGFIAGLLCLAAAPPGLLAADARRGGDRAVLPQRVAG